MATLSQGPQPQFRNMLADAIRNHTPTLANRLNDPTSGAGLAVDAVGGLADMLIGQPYRSMANLLSRPYVSGDPQAAEDAFNVAGAAMTGGLLAPRPRNSLGTGGRPEAPNQSAGIRAYHGSPHDFDRFDMSKIGTGEGAQAYGHGLYFAESEGVAKSYRDKLTPAAGNDTAHAASVAVKGYGEQAALAQAESAYRQAVASGDAAEAQRLAGVVDHIRNGTYKTAGRMYEVNIRANPDDFLDWDAPLSRQSEKVRTAVEPVVRQEAAIELERRAAQGRMADMRIREMGVEPKPRPAPPSLDDMVRNFTPDLFAKGREDELRRLGIPGIRYLDQGSRGAGEGSRNYVVFDDNLIEILRKYGLAGLMAGGAATGMVPQAPSQPNQLAQDWTRNLRPGDI